MFTEWKISFKSKIVPGPIKSHCTYPLRVPLSPAPVFRCGRFLVEGFVATARQATVGIPGCPPPLPLPVGRRRFGSSRHPASPPRPPVKLYTDIDVTLEHPGGKFLLILVWAI